MEYVTLKNSDLKVSRICMGGCPMGGYGWGNVQENELPDKAKNERFGIIKEHKMAFQQQVKSHIPANEGHDSVGSERISGNSERPCAYFARLQVLPCHGQ